MCREYVSKSILDQIKYYLRVGVMFDVKSIYSTMSRDYQFLQLEIFKQMMEKGLIYRDNRVIFWSAEEKRILDLEDLEEKSELSDCIVVKFPIKSYLGESKLLEEEYAKQNKQLYLLGFLSEPWKYVGVRALAINPDVNYCIAKMKEDYFICSYKRIPELAKRFGEKSPQILHMAKGSAFMDLVAQDPLFNRELNLVPMKDIKDVFGTGINILSPAHDLVPERITRTYNLSLEGFLNEENYFTPGLGLTFQKTHFVEGNRKLVNKLNSSKSLLASWKFENYFYENKRNGERVVLRSIPSWFFRLGTKLKRECYKELSLVDYYPELNFDKEINEKTKYEPRKLKNEKEEKEKTQSGYNNLIEEIEELDEWCISEINSWGQPIPYFIYKNKNSKDFTFSDKILLNSEIVEHIQKLFFENGSDIWWTWPVEDLLPEKYKSEADNLTKGKENFDPQFDKSISWFNILLKDTNLLTNDESSETYNSILSNGIEQLSIHSDILKIDKSEIVNRSKDHLKVLNNKLREFVMEGNKNSIEEENQDENESEINIDSITSVKNILPKEETINHMRNKLLNLTPKNLFPADFILENYNHHSNWFLHSVLTSVAFFNNSPFRAIKTQGLLMDSLGKIISKQNYIDPLDAIDGTIKTDGQRHFGYGSDSLRLFFLKNDSDQNFKLFEMFLEETKSDVKLVRKVAKTCLSLLNDYEKSFECHKPVNMIDQILVNEWVKCVNTLSVHLDNYNMKEYISTLLKFTKDIFYDCYLEFTKRNIILLSVDSMERKSSQFVLNEIFLDLVKLFNPIIPFTCEDIYSHCNHLKDRKKYLGFESLPTLESTFVKFEYSFNNDLNFNGENLLKIKKEINKEIDEMLKKKSFSNLKRNQLEILFLAGENEDYGDILLETLGESLSDFLGVSNVYLNENEHIDNNPEILKKRKIYFHTGVEKVTVKLNYAIIKSKKNECPRCLFFRSKEENKICEQCKNMMSSECDA